MNIKELENLNKKIEILNDKQHIEILRIIHKYSHIKLSENKNGIFINMNELDDKILNEIQNYLKYIETKEKELKIVENKKDKLIESLNETN